MAKTKPIRDALRATLYPYVQSLGFELDKRWQPEFVVFRRFGVSTVQIFQIQWDKYHRPKFVINFSEAPVNGVEFGGKWMDVKDVAPVHCGTYLKLMHKRGKFTYRWFQQRRPIIGQLLSLKRDYDPDDIALQVMERFCELEDWWSNKTIGKHVYSY